MRLLSSNRNERGALCSSSIHRYGAALGLPALREALIRKLEQENGLDMAGQEVHVCHLFIRLYSIVSHVTAS